MNTSSSRGGQRLVRTLGGMSTVPRSRQCRRCRSFTGPAAAAGDCYRFCLSNPNVDLVVSAPKTAAHMRENMQALERGPLACRYQPLWRNLHVPAGLCISVEARANNAPFSLFFALLAPARACRVIRSAGEPNRGWRLDPFIRSLEGR